MYNIHYAHVEFAQFVFISEMSYINNYYIILMRNRGTAAQQGYSKKYLYLSGSKTL